MEHRCSSRQSRRYPITLAYPRATPVAATSRDISPSGMFIETDGFTLPVNSPLYISIDVGSGFPNVFRLEAMVVRCAPDGMAVMFLDVAGDMVDALCRALDEPVTPFPDATAALSARRGQLERTH